MKNSKISLAIKFVILFFVWFGFQITAKAQDINTLENQLKSASDNDKLDILYKLATQYLAVDLKKSIDDGNQMLTLAKKLKNTAAEIKADNVLGKAYNYKNDYSKAAKYHEDELNLREKTSDKNDLMKSFYDVGGEYRKADNDKKAAEIYERSLKYARQLKSTDYIVKNYEALYESYTKAKKPTESVYYFKLYTAMRDSLAAVKNKQTISKIETKLKSEEENKLKTEKEKSQTQLLEKEKLIKKKDAVLQEKDKKLEITQKESDSLFGATVEQKQQIDQLFIERKYKESMIALQESQIKLKDTEISKQNMQRKYLLAIGGVILLLLILASFSIYFFRQTNRKLAHQNAEILRQKNEIEEKNGQLREALTTIAHKNKNITDSIRYAQRIQNAILPSVEMISDVMPDHFILFKPRDIVSGDFYWMKKINHFLIVAAADCTGHGVPGAFMSMLGVTLLNEIVRRKEITKASEVLNELRVQVKLSLSQTGKENEQRDGMDIALVVFDLQKKELQFAGANNSLYIVHNASDTSPEIDTSTDKQMVVKENAERATLVEIKADNMPIGIWLHERDTFTNHIVRYRKGDTFYLFSDGYADQFGGAKELKFLSKRFKKLLLSIYDQPMDKQGSALEKNIEDWKGNNDQVDDIMVMGLRV